MKGQRIEVGFKKRLKNRQWRCLFNVQR